MSRDKLGQSGDLEARTLVPAWNLAIKIVGALNWMVRSPAQAVTGSVTPETIDFGGLGFVLTSECDGSRGCLCEDEGWLRAW